MIICLENNHWRGINDNDLEYYIGKKRMRNSKELVPARIYQKIQYVLASDIETCHGPKFMKKFDKLFCGSTGMIVPANDKSHGLKKPQLAIYYWDYQRFHNQIVKGVPTYFD